MTSIETAKQNIIKLLDEATGFTHQINHHSLERFIKKAHQELFLLSKAYSLQEFRDAKEGLNNILERGRKQTDY